MVLVDGQPTYACTREVGTVVVPLDRIAMLSGDTAEGPDELYTTSSLSVEMSGASVRLVCAEVRAKALERAALRLNCGRDELSVLDGQFLQNGMASGQDYWTVAGEIGALARCPWSVERRVRFKNRSDLRLFNLHMREDMFSANTQLRMSTRRLKVFRLI